MKNVLIVGFGSIGKRHAGVYKQLGSEIALVSSRNDENYKTYSSLDSALKEFKPEIVIISNETSHHLKAMNHLQESGYKGVVVVEKPLSEKPFNFKHNFKALIVSYNLRESEVLKKLKSEIESKKIITANVSCGQYLPDWRPGRDYREIYSAKKEMGGGVLRDLSHELDYVVWLFGQVKQVAAIGGHLSDLEINSDDVVMFIANSEKCPAISVSLNYLDRVPRREIIVNCSDATYSADLIKGQLLKNGEVILKDDKVAETYVKQAKNILDGKFDTYCTYEQGNAVLKLIEDIEKSYTEKGFVSL